MSVSNNFPEDLLRRFISRNHLNHKLHEETEEEEDEKEVELSLGLSLNGKFGVDPRDKTLSRSSSIPNFINPARENDIAFAVPVVGNNLGRTYSLPTKREEEWRKRKEMQTLRRMEAKRKRSEKQRNLKAVKDWKREFGEGGFEEDKTEHGIVGNRRYYHQEQLIKNFNSLSGAGLDGLITSALVPPAPFSQGSIGSHGSGSSGTSESESQQVQGMNQCAEVRSPAGVQFLQTEQKMMVNSCSTASEKSGRFVGHPSEDESHRLAVTGTKAKEMLRNVFEDMPCVATRGDGPNEKRIEGFLYRYGKGEEARIVCVCHGSFFSPAEFVKHGGGVDVEHPLKHIVVNPSPLL